jgi:hypothetical protein
VPGSSLVRRLTFDRINGAVCKGGLFASGGKTCRLRRVEGLRGPEPGSCQARAWLGFEAAQAIPDRCQEIPDTKCRLDLTGALAA